MGREYLRSGDIFSAAGSIFAVPPAASFGDNDCSACGTSSRDAQDRLSRRRTQHELACKRVASGAFFFLQIISKVWEKLALTARKSNGNSRKSVRFSAHCPSPGQQHHARSTGRFMTGASEGLAALSRDGMRYRPDACIAVFHPDVVHVPARSEDFRSYRYGNRFARARKFLAPQPSLPEKCGWAREGVPCRICALFNCLLVGRRARRWGRTSRMWGR
jgi:hypothetical protein